LIFELSKVEKLSIREKIVSHLLNIDNALAKKVTKGLRLKSVPVAEKPAIPVNQKLKASPALSILKNPSNTFATRKLGVLVTDNFDAALFNKLTKAFSKLGAVVEFIVPEIGGITLSDGKLIPGNQNIAGGPSVLYDAVALLVAEGSAAALAKQPAVRDFISDAFAHFKYIAYVDAVNYIFKKIGLADDLDDGCINLQSKAGVDKFVENCAKGRYWEREMSLIG
jgi:catalase